MLDTTLLLSFLGAVCVFLVSPGPTSTLLCSTGISHGFSAALYTGLGISTALLVSILVTVGGLSTLLLSLPSALAVIKLIGIGYFLYLALKAWLSLNKKISTRPLTPGFWSCFSQGFVIDALNPGGLLFLLSFLPQFVNPALGSVKVQLLLLGLIYTLCDATFNIIVAYFCSKVKTKLTIQPHLATSIFWTHASVGIYVALAIYCIVQAR